ncbi:hypothetical protein R3P38DRAFT_2774485 [Favolaschia claudopus]|uniref:Uncharacterized protein n=1 Tax=Favolaschia claudopus TaxID=2862362 RepID=A0AAW0BVZ3_9AGAR
MGRQATGKGHSDKFPLPVKINNPTRQSGKSTRKNLDNEDVLLVKSRTRSPTATHAEVAAAQGVWDKQEDRHSERHRVGKAKRRFGPQFQFSHRRVNLSVNQATKGHLNHDKAIEKGSTPASNLHSRIQSIIHVRREKSLDRPPRTRLGRRELEISQTAYRPPRDDEDALLLFLRIISRHPRNIPVVNILRPKSNPRRKPGEERSANERAGVRDRKLRGDISFQ